MLYRIFSAVLSVIVGYPYFATAQGAVDICNSCTGPLSVNSSILIQSPGYPDRYWPTGHLCTVTLTLPKYSLVIFGVDGDDFNIPENYLSYLSIQTSDSHIISGRHNKDTELARFGPKDSLLHISLKFESVRFWPLILLLFDFYKFSLSITVFTCAEDSLFSNATLTPTPGSNTTFTVTCLPGFSTVNNTDSQIIACEKRGWTAFLPCTVYKAECDKENLLVNATFSPTHEGSDTTFNITCLPGYGTANATEYQLIDCLNGEWTDFLPCLEVSATTTTEDFTTITTRGIGESTTNEITSIVMTSSMISDIREAETAVTNSQLVMSISLSVGVAVLVILVVVVTVVILRRKQRKADIGSRQPRSKKPDQNSTVITEYHAGNVKHEYQLVDIVSANAATDANGSLSATGVSITNREMRVEDDVEHSSIYHLAEPIGEEYENLDAINRVEKEREITDIYSEIVRDRKKPKSTTEVTMVDNDLYGE